MPRSPARFSLKIMKCVIAERLVGGGITDAVQVVAMFHSSK